MSKPTMDVSKISGNIFSLAGEACKILRKAGLKDEVPEMQKKIFASHSYEEALVVISEHVEITFEADEEEEEEDEENEINFEEEDDDDSDS